MSPDQEACSSKSPRGFLLNWGPFDKLRGPRCRARIHTDCVAQDAHAIIAHRGAKGAAGLRIAPGLAAGAQRAQRGRAREALGPPYRFSFPYWARLFPLHSC